MRLLDITATAGGDGNAITLSWRYPPALTSQEPPPGVRVVRGRDGYPAGPHDGVTVSQGIGLMAASDERLRGETVHYYGLFPFTGDPPAFDADPDDARHNRAAALATSPYGFADLLYSLLPAVYRRYDAQTAPAPGTAGPPGRDDGWLRRFLELPGGELDRLYSTARACLGLIDPALGDARLLPLLAQWIGWRIDHRLPLHAQRNEIRCAPRIYRSIGSVPALDATVARVTGWPNRTKEFVHNVARTNRPERLNLWSMLRDAQGTWSPPTLASVNFAYDGRPTAVQEPDGSSRFFYHTHRLHGWDIWTKRFQDGQWQPSEPLFSRPGIDKHPTVARQGDVLRLFWQGQDSPQSSADRTWRIWTSVRTGTTWSEPTVFGDGDTERRMPAAVADNAGGVWLFWLERQADGWQLTYNRHDGGDWQLATPQSLPSEDDAPRPRVEDDLFVLFHPGNGVPKLWLFWARQEPGDGEGHTRWHLLLRSKEALDPSVADWSRVTPLLRAAQDDHDRHPAALLHDDGAVELFWSSSRGGGRHVVRSTLPPGSQTWGTAEPVTTGPHTSQAPLAVRVKDGGTLLVHRSSQSLAHGDTTSATARTLDHRYAGTTTVDTRASERLALRGTYEDFQSYLYDTGRGGVRGDDVRIARDTVGLYLRPDSQDPDEVAATVSRLAGVLQEVMPVSARAVFITD